MLLAAVLIGGCGGGSHHHAQTPTSSITTPSTPPVIPSGIHKIKHVVIIMQENRSFDQYFGTYPGADGIPGIAGNPGPVPCVPDPVNGGCVSPFHDTNDKNYGGPHGATRLDRCACGSR